MQNTVYDLIIIGGGASGLMSGVMAARSGLKVVIIERLRRAGRKLLATGGGRCNYTRNLSCAELLTGYYGKKNFVRQAIYNSSPECLIDFFAEIGLKSFIESAGGVYPESQRAQDVLAVLETEYSRNEGDFIFAQAVDEILSTADGVRGVMAGGQAYFARNVLLAGGGSSMQELGADGSGFLLAGAVGHNIVQPVPGLVGLVVPELSEENLAGLSLKAVLKYVGERREDVFSGDILLTHRGVSGPVILDVSREVCRDLARKGEAFLRICWGGYSAEFWDELFFFQRRENGRQRVSSLLTGYYPRRFVEYIMRSTGVSDGGILAEFSKESYRRLREQLVDGRFAVKKSEGFSRAMVTSGGVDTAEVNPKTMESRIIPGLYFAGEVLDVDGRCGGYNLEWAFASGRLAAEVVSKRYKSE